MLGGLVLAAMGAILALAFLGVTGPSFVSLPVAATLWAMASALVVLTAASMYLYFTLRSASRLLAQHELKLQRVFERSQNLRIQSLEDSRQGSRAGSIAQDDRLSSLEHSREASGGIASDSGVSHAAASAARFADDGRRAMLEDARRGVSTATATMLVEIARLEACIAVLDEPRAPSAKAQ